MLKRAECAVALFSTSIKQYSIMLLFLIVVLLQMPSTAQVLYGSMIGNVTDPNGAVVAGAKVEARNQNTGTVQEATTDSAGIYRFVTVLPGTYTITIAAPGFAKQENQNILVIVNTVRRVDASLRLGQVTESVNVVAEAALLQTDKSDVHTDLTAREIGNLPINFGSSVGGRNFQTLLRIIPGVGQIQEDNSQAGNPQRAINANINGQSRQTINTRIDGAQNAYPWLPANVAYVPPADAIETVNVVTNSYDAEQGMAGGAAVNVQIKSGTNAFHGSAHEFYTDQNLRARNYFQTDLTRFPVQKPKNIQHQYGGTIGGPIIKDKLFFFGDYERTTQRVLGTLTRTLPTIAMRQGDFRGLGVNIYDPNTGDPSTGAGKQIISCDGVQNVICADRIDPAALEIVNRLPTNIVDTTNNQNNFTALGTGEFNRDNFDVKTNYIPSQKSMLFVRYSMSRSHIFDPNSLGDPNEGGAGGDAINGGQLGNADSRIQSVGLGVTYSFTPNILADWNVGFTRQRLGAENTDLTQAYGLDVLGIPGTNGAGAPGDPRLYNGFPAFQITSVSNIGNPNTGNPFLFRDNQYVTGANLSWIKGKHGFRFGFEYNHTQLNHFQPQGGNFQTARGTFGFNGNVTTPTEGNPSPQNPYNSWADFLLGLPNRAGKAVANQNPTSIRWSQWAWYARDQWQVTQKLTLSLGVRWEFYPFAYSDNGRGVRVFDPVTGDVLIGGRDGVPIDNGVDVGNGQFLPRVGVAYRLTNKTVIRAGYGMSADPNNFRYFRNSYPATSNSDFNQQGSANRIPVASLTGTNATGGFSALPLGLTLIPALEDPPGRVSLPLTAPSTGTTTIANPFRRGYINSFNLTVQQEIAGFSLEAGYVGARAIRPLTNMNINPGTPGGGSAQSRGILTQRYRAAGLLATPTDPNSCATVSGQASCLTGNINAETPFKNNYYDSLQAKLTRRLGGGSLIGIAYTLSKAINYSDNEELNFLLFPHPDNWEKARGLASFDRTHNLQIYGVYELPFGRGKNLAQSGVASALAGGWQVSWALSKTSGIPFTVTGDGGLLGANGATQTADLIGDFRVIGGKPLRTGATCALDDLSCRYFDASVFAQPTAAQFGNTGRHQFRGPGVFSLDMGISRNFKLTERFSLQLRAEAFSLTNTPNFNNPNLACNSAAGQPCSTAASNNNFGVITQTLGANPGTRTIWFSGKLMF